MATVKIHEGTKFETPLDLEDDEGIVFVVPEKNRIRLTVNPGCLWQLLWFLTLGIICIFVPKARNRQWNVNFVLTNKRVIIIPCPPNKKGNPVESFYWKDIVRARAQKTVDKSQAAAFAILNIMLKDGSVPENFPSGDIQFYLSMEMTRENIRAAREAARIENAAKNATQNSIIGQSWGDGVYTQKSMDKYYAAMEKRAKDRAANMDFSSADHNQMRDYIVDVINDCVDEANKG